MLNNNISGITYRIEPSFYWGTHGKDVESTLDSSKNVTRLDPEHVVSVEIVQSLATPFFHGSIVYDDPKDRSDLASMVDMPVVYGHLLFCAENGSDIPGSDNVPGVWGEESFDEEILVTSVNTIPSVGSQYVRTKIGFTSIDVLKFISNLTGFSTFENWDKKTDELPNVLSALFGAAELGDKLDMDSITVHASIPFITTCNTTLLGSLDYIYRKIFDYNYKVESDKVYCRMVYDHVKRKYKLWKFSDIGTKKMVDTGVQDDIEKVSREKVQVDCLGGGFSTGVDGLASVKSSGNLASLFSTLSDNTFIDYDYVQNVFDSASKKSLDKMVVDHEDELVSGLKNGYELVLANGKYFKNLKYDNVFTYSRQNGSLYDMFTETIFRTKFIRAESDGAIGRKPGDGIILDFNNSTSTIYNDLFGDYLITGIRSRYERNGEQSSFRQTMDLYRPFVLNEASRKNGIV